MYSVAIATAAAVAMLDDDRPLLIDALADLGIDAAPAVWDAADVAWGSFDLVVIRSTWDYVDRRDEFVAWARHVESVGRIANPAPMVAWNTDKRYLSELAAAGVPVVPTGWAGPTDPTPDIDGLDALIGGAGSFVVKPSVSAGSRDTNCYEAADRSDRALAVAHVSRLQRDGRTAMIQPYLEAVDTAGETALVFVGGTYSHAIRKGPMLRGGAAWVDGLYYSEQITEREASRAEREVADSVLAAIPSSLGRLLYARVDLIPGADGSPTLIELEATEPSLFHVYAPGSAERFAAAIAAALED